MATNISTDTVTTSNVVVSPQTNKPGGPVEGQVISGTGTGDIAKGIYRYTGGSWESLDNAQGDLNTLRLILSTDTNAVGFAAALNSTSTLAGNTNAVPYETSTGTAMLGALEIPSTGGDALLTEFDADRVFRYYSAGANNKNDYFGITVDIPAWCRNQNIVIEFQYRTEEASDATSNDDFLFSVWDKTNGVSTTQDSTLSTGTTISAGSNILMTAKTSLAVGDKIWFESGTAATGNIANSITETYITSISSTDNNITVAKDVVVVASGQAVTGWLSDTLDGLPSADSDTDKEGKSYSLQVKTAADTAQINLYWSNKSTTTNVIELFFDGILISANKFLQANAQLKPESYTRSKGTAWWLSSTGTAWSTGATYRVDWSGGTIANTPGPDTPTYDQSKYLDFTTASNDSPGTATTVSVIKAKKKVALQVTVGADLNDDETVRIYLSRGGATGVLVSNTQQRSGANDTSQEVSASVVLDKEDYVYFYTVPTYSSGWHTIIATPIDSPVVILESQDEIFTDWTAWTPTGTWTSNVTYEGYWRRSGSNMQIRAKVTCTGAPNSSTLAFDLPPGYVIAEGPGTLFTGNAYGDNNFTFGRSWMQDGGGGNVDNTGNVGYESSTSLSITASYADSAVYVQEDPVSQVVPFTWASTDSLVMEATVPIQGWNSNFNPLLSMPLVEIGANVEEYHSTGWGNIVGCCPYDPTTVRTNTINLLGTVSDSSTAGWHFIASQRVKVTLSGYADSTGGDNTVAIVRGPSTIGVAADSDATMFPYVVAKEYNNSGHPGGPTASVLLEPGEIIKFALNRSDALASEEYAGGAFLRVEKDFSNTNMAHIIKPAVALIQDVKAYDVDGGTATSGSWADRTLNIITGESWFINSLSSNVFELQAGTYEIEVRSPFYQTGYASSRLYDTTNSAVVKYGNSEYLGTGTSGESFLKTLMSPTSATSYKIQNRVSSTRATDGLGLQQNSDSTAVSVYTTVQIRKLK